MEMSEGKEKGKHNKLNKKVGDLLIGGSIVLILCVLYGKLGCPIRLVAGISCPGCGMTRAVMSLCRLDFAQAIYYHPLVFFMPVILLFVLIRNRLPGRVRKGAVALFVIIFAVVWIYRMVCTDGMVVFFRPQEGIIGRILGKFGVIFTIFSK